MVKGAAQARKKKVVKNDPVEETAPPVEEVPAAEEVPAVEDAEEAQGEMDVSLEPTEGEEDVMEPGDEILEDDNNNAEEYTEDVVNEEDLEDEEFEEGDEEEGGEETKEGEETEENGESKKRKAEGAEPAAKKLKVEPKPVRMNLYVKRTATDSFDTSIETFLRDNEIEIQEFKPNPDPAWTLAGQVTLTKSEDREKILNLSGTEVDAREVKFEVIEEPNKGEDSLKKLQAPDEVILFVRNLHKTVTEEELKKVFPTCVELHLPQKGGRIKGFAFLQFGTKEEVQEMLKTKQSVELSGRKLVLSRFASRSSGDGKSGRSQRPNKNKDQVGNSQNRVLFVGNLSFDTKEEKIMRIFRTAENVKILRFANTGKSKGVAFIEFRTPVAARKAFEKFSNAKIDGRSINLEYADQDKFKAGERGTVNRVMVTGGGGRRLSGGGRPIQNFNAGGGRQFRNAGQIRSLLDTIQLERSMEFENRFNRMGNMDGGMGSRMNMGMDGGMGGRMSLDSNLGMDSGYGSRMSMDSNIGGRMGLDGGMSDRMSLDGAMGRRMGMDSGYGMGDRLSLDSGYGNRLGMDSGMGNFGSGRMGGMDGNFGGGFKNRGMNNRMRQGNRKGWN